MKLQYGICCSAIFVLANLVSQSPEAQAGHAIEKSSPISWEVRIDRDGTQKLFRGEEINTLQDLNGDDDRGIISGKFSHEGIKIGCVVNMFPSAERRIKGKVVSPYQESMFLTCFDQDGLRVSGFHVDCALAKDGSQARKIGVDEFRFEKIKSNHKFLITLKCEVSDRSSQSR